MDKHEPGQPIATLAAVPPLATAPDRPAPDQPQARPRNGAGGSRLTSDAAIGLAIVAGLTLLVFLSGGGVDLAQNTWVEIALVVIAAALAITVVLVGAPGRAWGLGTLILFTALAALTALSISWSVEPANSWLAANQTLSYLAAFAAALALARLFPERWPALTGAIAILATIVCAYGLLVKVFPASLDASDIYGRLSAPFGYWNATGLMAALGLPACVWAGARRERGRATRALAAPAIAILVAVLMLSYSRGALLAAIGGLAFWFVFVPLRLRGTMVLAIGAAGGAAISLWAFATHALTHDGASLQSRTSAGHGFGLVLIVVLALLTMAGFAASYWVDRTQLPDDRRRKIGTVLVVLVALVPVAGVGALAVSSRGLTGQVSHLWSTLTSTNSNVSSTNPSRILAAGNTRGRYWNEALKVGEHALLKGVGAAGFTTAAPRYVNDYYATGFDYAHGYVAETFADFGLIGLALTLALLIGWLVAAARSVGARTPVEAEDGTSLVAERTGLLTLAATVLIFGIHSTIDWTWFVPGTAVPALVCAGWLAGRGPLASPVGRRARRRELTASPGAAAAVFATLIVTVLCGWAIWQPLRSSDSDAAAVAAWSRGDTATALTQARAAITQDPLAVEPLWLLSSFDSGLRDGEAARAELVKATTLQPDNVQTWVMLGQYDVGAGRPDLALTEFQRALQLDRANTAIQTDLAQARAAALAR